MIHEAKKRKHKPTSKEGENFIAPFKQSHKEKIVMALNKSAIGYTHEEIAEASGLRPDQVWKRLSELATEGKIYDSGLTRKLKSSVMGIIWKIKEVEKSDLDKWFNDYQNEKPTPTYYQQNLL